MPFEEQLLVPHGRVVLLLARRALLLPEGLARLGPRVRLTVRVRVRLRVRLRARLRVRLRVRLRARLRVRLGARVPLVHAFMIR